MLVHAGHMVAILGVCVLILLSKSIEPSSIFMLEC